MDLPLLACSCHVSGRHAGQFRSSFCTSIPEKRCRPGAGVRTGSSPPQRRSEASRGISRSRLMAQLHALLEWFGRFNQPSNVEEMRATRRHVDQRRVSKRESARLFFRGQVVAGHHCRRPVGDDSRKGSRVSHCEQFAFLLSAWLQLWLLCSIVWLKRAIAARKDAFQRAIPDALDLMVVCVEAGLGLDQAIARVGEEVKRTHPELSDELNMLVA